MRTRSDKAIIIVDEPDISNPREPVPSSSISHIGWDDETRTLWVTFRASDITYKYLGVLETDYERLMNADSIGIYFGKYIKPFFQCEGES